MRFVDDRINVLVDQQGWNDSSLLSLLEQFILDNGMGDELYNALAEQANAEEQHTHDLNNQ